jgi:hypothetical protein
MELGNGEDVGFGHGRQDGEKFWIALSKVRKTV